MAKSVRRQVVLELRAIRIVIGRITVDESIKKERVEWHPPVDGRWMERMVFPFPPVAQGLGSGPILIEIEPYLFRVIMQSGRAGCQKYSQAPQQ